MSQNNLIYCPVILILLATAFKCFSTSAITSKYLTLEVLCMNLEQVQELQVHSVP